MTIEMGTNRLRRIGLHEQAGETDHPHRGGDDQKAAALSAALASPAKGGEFERLGVRVGSMRPAD
jgi:hypothetical protein